MSEPRRIDVAVDRLDRWIAGFVERHGEPTWSREDRAYRLDSDDGAWAKLSAWHPTEPVSPGVMPVDLAGWARAPEHFAIVLIRRGGYAVGRVRGADLVAHKCGTRYVQSRTAAGGWSQQRYARRRSNQADALVDKTVEQVAVLLQADSSAEGLVVGGDTSLTAAVLTDRRLVRLLDLPQREFYDIPDPRLRVLHSVADRAHSVSVTVSNGPS